MIIVILLFSIKLLKYERTMNMQECRVKRSIMDAIVYEKARFVVGTLAVLRGGEFNGFLI